MVLQRHDSGRPVVAVLVRIALALLFRRVVLVMAIPGGDAREGIREEVRRVWREDLLHLAEVDALHDLVHLREVTVVADDKQRLADALNAGEAVDDDAEVPRAVVDVEHDHEVAIWQAREPAGVAGRQRVALGEREGQRALARQPWGEGWIEQDLPLRDGVVGAGGGAGAEQARGRGEVAAGAGAEELGDDEDRDDDGEEERRSAGAEAGAVVMVVRGRRGGGGGHGGGGCRVLAGSRAGWWGRSLLAAGCRRSEGEKTGSASQTRG